MRSVTYIPPTKRKKMTKARRVKIFLARNGVCGCCGLQIRDGESWDIEHPDALELGGSDDDSELWPVHAGPNKCHPKKTAHDRKLIAARNGAIDRGYVGASKKRKWRPMPGGRDSPIKKRMDGTIVARSRKTQAERRA